MNGMQLTRHYAYEIAIPALRDALGDEVFSHLALGSVGDGSDRFGFDDEISRDHDWGVSLVVWGPDHEDEVLAKVRSTLASRIFHQGEIAVLGFIDPCPAGRAGAMTVEEHYRRFTACPHGPRSTAEWSAVSEQGLAACTNGQVFIDGSGEFSKIRSRLLEGYPREVRLERIAQRLFQFSQAGQYNLVRALIRRDTAGAYVAYARAYEAASMLAHVLDERYCPYYKWMQASLEQGSPFARRVASALKLLADPKGALVSCDAERVQEEIGAIAGLFVTELQRQEIITGDSLFLLDHVEEIQASARATTRDDTGQEQEQCRKQN